GYVLERDHRTAVAATPVAAVVRGRGRGPVTRLVLAHVVPLCQHLCQLLASSGRCFRRLTPSAPNTTIRGGRPGSAVPQEPPMTCVIPHVMTRPVREPGDPRTPALAKDPIAPSAHPSQQHRRRRPPNHGDVTS